MVLACDTSCQDNYLCQISLKGRFLLFQVDRNFAYLFCQIVGKHIIFKEISKFSEMYCVKRII